MEDRTVAAIECVECERQADGRAEGWEAHLLEPEDDGPAIPVFFCPSCAAREFWTTS